MYKNSLLIVGMTIAGLMAAPKKNEPVERISEAARVFSEIQGAADKGVPDTLLSKANGIIIVPGLKRAGFVIGGEYGKGVMSCRSGELMTIVVGLVESPPLG